MEREGCENKIPNIKDLMCKIIEKIILSRVIEMGRKIERDRNSSISEYLVVT